MLEITRVGRSGGSGQNGTGVELSSRSERGFSFRFEGRFQQESHILSVIGCNRSCAVEKRSKPDRKSESAHLSRGPKDGLPVLKDHQCGEEGVWVGGLVLLRLSPRG